MLNDQCQNSEIGNAGLHVLCNNKYMCLGRKRARNNKTKNLN